MQASIIIRLLLVTVFLGFTQAASAATVSWGALATSTITSCDDLGNCDINSLEQANGGSSSASASTLIDTDPRGTSSAEATLSGSAMTPTLRALADASAGPNQVLSTASGIQAYTNLDVDRTITLNLSLSVLPFTPTTLVNPFANAATAQVAVFLADSITITGDDFSDILLDPILQTPIASDLLLASPFLSLLNTSFEFDVAAGQDFLIWAGLQTIAEDGGTIDARNTLTVSLFEGNLELGPDQLAIASEQVGVIPLPAGVWLFLTGVGLVAGLSRRRKLPTAG